MINILINYLGEEWRKRLGVKILVRNQFHSPTPKGMNAKTKVSNLSKGGGFRNFGIGRKKKNISSHH